VNIDLKQLEELLKVLEQRNVTEFEFEDEKVRVRLGRGQPAAAVAAAAPLGAAPGLAQAPPPQGPPAAAPAGVAPAAPADENVVLVTSPFVGTFYRAPSPGAPPFVEVGDTVKRGQVMCIVEAMKLMNEIESEFSGTIVDCLVENAHPVEFGQKLFKIKKA